MSEFFKWLIYGWSMVVVGIAALGTILIVRYGEIKRIETDDITLCFIIAFFCWLIPIVAFIILEPRGLAEVWRIVRSNFRLWPFSY